MVRLTIEIPEDLRDKARSQATEAGHPSVEAYLRDLLQEAVESGPPGAPPAQTFRDAAQLESMLRAGVESGPAVELTDADWERKRQQLTTKVRGTSRP